MSKETSKTYLKKFQVLALVLISVFLYFHTVYAASPAIDSLSPNTGTIYSSFPLTLTATFSDTDGWQNIQSVYFQINTSADGLNCVYAYYDQNTNLLYLRDEANASWIGGYSPGSNNIIENDYVKIDCLQTNVSGSSSTFIVNWNITLKSSFSGTKKAYLYAMDDSGVYQDWTPVGAYTIVADTTAPTGSLSINNDAQFTKSQQVVLSLLASDAESGMGTGALMQFSTDGIAWSVPQPYYASMTWTLTSGDGIKNIYVKYRDIAGNWSNAVSGNIILDTAPPVIISSWPAKGSFIGTQGGPLNLNIVYGDALSGVEPQRVKLTDEKGNDITWSAQASENNIEYVITTPTDKQYRFNLYLEDRAGNNLQDEFIFTVDATVPEISANLIGGAFNAPVTVKLQCSEQATIYYSTDGYPPMEGAANTTAVNGSSASVSINKTTNLQFFALDAAGNRSPTKMETYFFNELPAPVTALQGIYNENAKRVELQWQAASGITGYHVYRAINIQEINLLKDSSARKYPAPQRLRISINLLNENLFYDTDVLSEITYWYGVSVIDMQGKESPVSELISVKVSAQLPPVSRKEAARRALAWIEANQKAQGYWGDKKEIQMLATSQILKALAPVFYSASLNAATISSKIWLMRGVFWLRGNFADNNDYLSRKILTLRAYGQNVDEEINRLVTESDLRGVEVYGWGVQKRYGSDALTTSLGALAFGVGSGSWRGWYDKIILTINGSYELAGVTRSLEGRYGWVPGKDTSIFVSSVVYYMIKGFKVNLDPTTYQWILDSQNPDGYFNSGLIDTAAVILWIKLDDVKRTNAINYLISVQSADGSWNNGDAYVTGLCFEAILPRTWPIDWNADW